SGLNTRFDLLHAAWQGVSTGYHHSSESLFWRGHIHPVAVVEMQNGGCGHGSIYFIFLATEGCGDKHAHFHHARIPHLDPDFAGPEIRVEDRQDIAHRSLEHLAWIRVQR